MDLLKNPYLLAQIPNFTARKGYGRCPVPGVGCSACDHNALADFWRTAGGNVVVRFSCEGYVFSFVAFMPGGDPIPDKDMEPFSSFIDELLLMWTCDGIDDTPRTEL